MTEHLTDVNQLPSKDQLVDDLRAVCRLLPLEIAGTAADEIQNLRTTLTGISTCSTCKACRGAARLALGEDVAKINAAVDERLDRVERELAEHPDHPKNDWECKTCNWMNFGSRTSCGHCEMSRPAQPPGDDHAG